MKLYRTKDSILHICPNTEWARRDPNEKDQYLEGAYIRLKNHYKCPNCKIKFPKHLAFDLIEYSWNITLYNEEGANLFERDGLTEKTVKGVIFNRIDFTTTNEIKDYIIIEI